MNISKTFSIFLIFIFLNNTNAQTGPGGVGNSTDNVLWLKANSGTSSTVNGQPISFWNDSSGNLNNTYQSNINQQPLFTSSLINGYPAIQFDFSQTAGQNDFLSGSDAPNLDNTNGLSIFSVIRPTNSGSARAIISKRNNVGVNQSYMLFFFSSDYFYVDIDNNNNRFSTSPTSYNTNTDYIISTLYNGSLPTASRVSVYNGETLVTTGSESSAVIPDYNSPFTIGATHIGDNRGFGGYMSEIIVYRKTLNTAERIIVNNYLSSKYNQSLSSNDIYVQDDIGNGNFDHHVAGIGQASDGTSHFDSQGTGIVRINTPSTTGSNRFLFWGEESQNPTYNFSTNTTNYTQQLNSKWRVSRQGNLGTVTVSFDISSMNLTGKPSCSPLQLVVDNNYDFSSPSDIYNLTIVGNTATATGVLLQNNRYFTLRYVDEIVWDGSNFFNGAGTGNAPNTTNACLKFTVKAGTTSTLIYNARVREVEVEAGATLNITNGFVLETENKVVNNGTIDLLGEAQLIQNHTGVSLNTGTGNLKIRQQGTSNLFNYNYWSAPVNRSGFWRIGYLEDANGSSINFTSGLNGNTSTTPITLSNRWLYTFNGPIGNYNAWTKISTSSNLLPGIGYSMKGSGAVTSEQEFIFRGTPNNGNYSIPVTAFTEILVGNPYPSALDANRFILDNLLTTSGTLYFWESFPSNNSHYLSNYEGGYATYNLLMSLPAIADASGLTSGLGVTGKSLPTRYINIGQGFFTTILNSGSLLFQNSQRYFARESLNETVFYKGSNKSKQTSTLTDERPKIWFSFTDPNNYIKTIGLGWDSNASYNYDIGYDAKTNEDFKNDVYWLLNDEKLVIQALPQINIDDILPLEIKISDAGLYKFSLSNMENIPEYLNIYLVDNIQSTYYNLRTTEAQLVLNSATKSNQFSIVFKESNLLGTTLFDNKNIVSTYNSNTKTLELHAENLLNSVESFKIFNTIGQEVLSITSPTSTKINLSLLTDGVYILKVNMKTNNNLESIKFVKY
ncbi:T9SS type A sorting domain-containing protein [Mariniflexile jejuense]|uniref:T9SS type A sorting domain-containing protein n=1 Tax=Mariniflexile jejuense TaxID=1173582 RepID=A0ABW3JI23_9FLAO